MRARRGHALPDAALWILVIDADPIRRAILEAGLRAAGPEPWAWVRRGAQFCVCGDANAARRALGRLELLVVSDAVAASDTARLAHVRLPAAAWGEEDGTVTNSERRISRRRAFLRPPGEARPDWRIVCDQARRLGHGRAFAFRAAAARSGRRVRRCCTSHRRRGPAQSA